MQDIYEVTNPKLSTIFGSMEKSDAQLKFVNIKNRAIAKQMVLKNQSFSNATCSNVGHLVYDYQQKDVCSGFACSAKEASCGGSTIVIGPESDSYNISTECSITKISCNNSQTYDMMAQFDAQNCVVEKVKCGNQEFLAPDVNNTQLIDCNVQVICDETTWYGFEYFGFSCEQQQLVCTFSNGSTFLLPANVSGIDLSEIQNCSVSQSACSSENLNGTDLCLDYNVECAGDIVNDCEFEIKRLSCASQPTCQVSQFICNGTVLNATDLNGSLTGCAVIELDCNNGSQILAPNSEFNATNCTIAQMICNGIVVNDPQVFSGQFFEDICNITRLKCTDSMGQCSVQKLACTNEPNCSIDSSQFLCVNAASCTQQVNETRCICPIDYLGEECQTPRSVSCSLQPTTNNECQTKNTKSSDSFCTISSPNQNISLCFDLDCGFSTSPTTSEQADAASQNFTYFLLSSRFNLSLETYWNMKMKVFNFNMLSDNSMIHNMSLGKNQMQGDQNVCWSLALANVSDRYWFGDRLYIEIAWNGNSPAGINSDQTLQSGFIDSPYDEGETNSTSSSDSSDTALILGVVFGVLGFGIVVLVWKNRHIVITKMKRLVTKID